MEYACNWIWGSCGCDLPQDGHKIHKCEPEIGDRCSEYDSEKQTVRHMLYVYSKDIDDHERKMVEFDWTEWKPFPYGTELIPAPI